LLETSRIEKLLPVVLSHEEIQKMLSVIDKSTYHGFRDSVIIEVLYACGLRISELLNLKKGDIYFKHEYIKVLGKGNKERLVPIGEKALQLLDLYIRNHRSKLKKIDQKCKDIVFLNRRGRKLTRQYVFLAIKTAAQQAEIKKNIHPHILRHSFASALVKGGANLIVVKEMMGHASVVSTEIYTHLDTTHLRETLMLYHPHYQNLNKKKSEES
ncbi:MAG: tyrosine-type recombinase/integrase, partial [Bacteroidales bacterium]|nr:tyrosine-type recombinase/integrase [Bacteroidales bacterium]